MFHVPIPPVDPPSLITLVRGAWHFNAVMPWVSPWLVMGLGYVLVLWALKVPPLIVRALRRLVL